MTIIGHGQWLLKLLWLITLPKHIQGGRLMANTDTITEVETYYDSFVCRPLREHHHGSTVGTTAAETATTTLVNSIGEENDPLTNPSITTTATTTTTMSSSSSTSIWKLAVRSANHKLDQVWNRYRFGVLRRLKRRIRKSLSNRSRSGMTTSKRTTSSPELAYRMMVMATMSYWEFHKRVLPSNATGFSLRKNDVDGRNKKKKRNRNRKRKRTTGRKRKFVARQLRYLKRSLVTLLLKGTIYPPLPLDANNGLGNTTTDRSSNSNGEDPDENDDDDDEDRLIFAYWMFDWYESGLAKARFHDTEVLIAYAPYDGSLVISFGGTSSAADAVTNIQTFEPANHSNYYHGGSNSRRMAQQQGDDNDDGTTATTTTTNWNKRRNRHRHHPMDDGTTTIQGSLHRGFLNAYSRVDRGSILRLCNNNNETCADHEQHDPISIQNVLHRSFGNCTNWDTSSSNKDKQQQQQQQQAKGIGGGRDDDGDRADPSTQPERFLDKTDGKDPPPTTSLEHTKYMNTTREVVPSQDPTETVNVRPRRKGDGCYSTGRKLSSILLDLTSMALQDGRTVHVTGHSLGGGLASHLALDIVINYPNIPIDNLHLWTFGAPQICDALFLTSAVNVAPRLGPFVSRSEDDDDDYNYDDGNGEDGPRLHRYVTLSDTCQVDAISEVAKRTLPAHRPKGIRRLLARRLGGVHDHIIHFVEPHYLLTPQQELRMAQQSSVRNVDSQMETMRKQNFDGDGRAVKTPSDDNSNTTADTTTVDNIPPTSTANTPHRTSTTHTAVAAHACVNYLMGISRESLDHPLQTDFPLEVREWLGEDLLFFAAAASSNDGSKNRSSNTSTTKVTATP